jgi:hypothetical protein
VHDGGFSIAGDPNGDPTFHDPAGNVVGRSRPRRRPPSLPTRAGLEIESIRERLRELRRERLSAPAA